ncbi:hypothetical protein L3H35_10780, partial [Corynebacterium sp. MC-21]|nr:hypothetical protein [Corynebacterium parakroppenstedtii]MCF6790267.1 hypothetical protein [Corynebacterium parakroppenstedtii]
ASWSNFLGIFQIFPSTQTEQNLGHFNTDRRWNYPLGNHAPDILQYGSNCYAAGYPGVVDVNAYRGSHDELRHLFTGN